jgi:hypothetical protein
MMILLVLSAIGAAPTPATGINPWAGRSGEAEARSDIAKGRPVKLFYQSLFGEREFVRTPGLSECKPDRFDVHQQARSHFEWLGADYSESALYTAEDRARRLSAVTFAKDYNRTMFRLRRSDVLRICPAATPDNL